MAILLYTHDIITDLDYYLLTKLFTTLETNTTVSNRNSMRSQVARSKGTEWMVSNYNAWQLRSPLPEMPEQNPLSLMPIVRRMAQKEGQLNSYMTVSFRSLLSIIGLLMSVRIR